MLFNAVVMRDTLCRSASGSVSKRIFVKIVDLCYGSVTKLWILLDRVER